MTNFATLAVLLLATSCAVSPEPAPAPPAKVFDFAPRPLDAAPAVHPGQSPKSQLRFVLDSVRPEIAVCVGDRVGSLELTFTIDLDPGRGATVEAANVDVFDDATVRECARAALLGLDTSAITLPESLERWTIHASLYTGAQ